MRNKNPYDYRIFYYFIIIFSLFIFDTSVIYAKENIGNEIQVYTRQGFQEDWLKEKWNQDNSVEIKIVDDNSIYIPVSDQENKNILYSDFTSIKDKTIQIQINPNVLKPLKIPVVNIQQLGQNWEIYQNSQLVDKRIDVDNEIIIKEHTTKNLIIPLFLNDTINGEIVLNIRILGNPKSDKSSLILNPNVFIGEYSEIAKENQEILPFLLIGIFSFLGVYLCYLYFKTRKYEDILFYGIFLLVYSIFTFTHSNYIYSLFSDTHNIYKLKVVSLGFSIIFITYFLDHFLIYKLSKITKIVSINIVLVQIIALFFSRYFLNLIIILTLLETIILFFYLSVFYKIYKKDMKIRKLKNEKFKLLKFLFKNRLGVIILNIFLLAFVIYLETFLNWKFNIKTPIVILGSLGLFFFMTIYIIQRMDDAFISQEKIKLSHREEKKRILLEKELSVQNERQKAFIDIHDEIGVDLNLLKMRLTKYIEEKILPSFQGNELLDFVTRVINGVRYRLQLLEDEKYFKEEFFFAIRLLLLRKYEYVNRSVDCEIDLDPDTIIQLTDNKKELLYKITREIANNDAKYGYGISIWNFKQSERKIVIHFNANSNYNSKDNIPGYGWRNIQSLVESINGSISSNHNGDEYSLQLTIPL